MWGKSLSAMPLPVLVMLSVAVPCGVSAASSTFISPAAGVNFTALERMLLTTLSTFPASIVALMCSGRRQESLMRLCSAAATNSLTTLPTSAARLVSASCKVIFPPSTFLKSSIWLMSFSNVRTFRCATSSSLRCTFDS